jgi:N-methylhydantoinase A
MLLDDDGGAAIADIYAELEARACVELDQLGGSGAPVWSRQGYMRYAGQGFEVPVDLPGGPIGDDFGALAVAAFNQAYLQKHKFLDPAARIEAVDWSLTATLPGAHGAADLAIAWTASATPGGRPASREAWFPEAGGYVPTCVMERRALSQGMTISGPAIVEDPDSTIVILPGDEARIGEAGHLIIEISPEAAA